MGLTSSSVGEWVPTVYCDFRENLNVRSPLAGISANAAHGDGHLSWKGSQGTGSDPGLPLLLGKISSKNLPFCVSVSLNEQ